MDFLIVGVLVLLSGCFSGLTLGFFSLNLTSLQRKMKLGDKRAKRIYPIRKNGNLLLCTLLFGNVAVNSAMAIFLGNIATGLVAGLVSTALIVVFGEIIPQAIFSRHALNLGYSTAWLVKGFIFLFYPIAAPMAWLLDKALGEEMATIWNKREIEEIIRHHEDADESEIDEDEERILLGALAFSDMTAQMIATPRSIVFSLPEDRKIDQELLIAIKDTGVSRIPVHTPGEPDDITGVLHIRSLLGVDLQVPKTLGELSLKDALLAKTDIRLDNLLNHFLASKKHLACLYDPFGSLTGIVTLEDVLEEILKTEIIDEADQVRDLRVAASKRNVKKLLE